jgi:hypothetical protein
MDLLVAAAVFLALHNVDGDEVVINVDHIVALVPSSQSKGKDNNTLMATGVNCIIALSDGKRISVVEHCSTVRQSIQQHENAP